MPKSKTPTYDALPENVQRIIDSKTDTPEGKENIAKRVYRHKVDNPQLYGKH